MIRSFADKETEKIFRRLPTKFGKRLQGAVHEKLLLLHAATSLDELRSPPGNRLEKLMGDRKGQYSIRVDKRFRLCFIWSAGLADAVELVDYH